MNHLNQIIVLKSKEKTYSFEVQSYHADINSNLALHQLFLFLQECAWAHAQENNFGYSFVESENALWVLSRVYVKLSKYPKWEDEIFIKTWPKKHKGLFALRDFEIKIGNEIVGWVLSSWLILDKETRRPRRMGDFEFIKSKFITQNAINRSLDKLNVVDEMVKVADRKVQWSDIDVNAHVNNASYVRWIADAIFEQKRALPNEFEINFQRELKIHQDFQVFTTDNGKNLDAKICDLKNRDICVVKASFE